MESLLISNYCLHKQCILFKVFLQACAPVDFDSVGQRVSGPDRQTRRFYLLKPSAAGTCHSWGSALHTYIQLLTLNTLMNSGGIQPDLVLL